MIEIYEIDNKLNVEKAKKFNLTAFSSDRVFIAKEKEEIGLGILSLDKGIVYIKEIFMDKQFAPIYFDLFARSILNVLIDFSPIRVRVDKDDYFLKFGFKENGDYLEIMSSDIRLCNHHHH